MAKFWISRTRPFILKERIHGYRAGQALVSLSYADSILLEKAAPGKGMKGKVPSCCLWKTRKNLTGQRKEPSTLYVIYVTLLWSADRHKGKDRSCLSEKESDSSIIDMLSGSFSLSILLICLTSFRIKGRRGSLNTVWYAPYGYSLGMAKVPNVLSFLPLKWNSFISMRRNIHIV